MPRLRSSNANATDGLTAAPGNKKELAALNAVIDTWDAVAVTAAISGESGIYGCDCGAKKTKAMGGACCDWNGRRIDVQRGFMVENIPFNSYNLQWGSNSYAAVNIQCGATFTAAAIITAFQHSLTQRKRIWQVNAAGKLAVEGPRGLEDDP